MAFICLKLPPNLSYSNLFRLRQHRIINTKQMAIVGLIVGVVGIVLAYLMLVFIGF